MTKKYQRYQELEKFHKESVDNAESKISLLRDGEAVRIANAGMFKPRVVAQESLYGFKPKDNGYLEITANK